MKIFKRLLVALLLAAAVGTLALRPATNAGRGLEPVPGGETNPTAALVAPPLVGATRTALRDVGSPGPTPAPTPPARIVGLAILGDSTQDEYRADNPRGGAYGATTLNWVELLARDRAVNLGAWGTRPEPRRSGYDYNWARSAATSATMISTGQHTGAAEQIRAGEVSHVIIQIGINDFYVNERGLAVYSGQLAGPQLQTLIDELIANVALAVRTVKAAGGARIILAATQDYVALALLPELGTVTPDPIGRQRVVATFSSINQGLREVAAREGVAFVDFNAAFQRELDARYTTPAREAIAVGGETIDLATRGDAPHHGFIGDGYAHPGTVLSALFANLYIDAMNRIFGTALVPLSDAEILRAAGIQATAGSLLGSRDH